MGPRATIIGGLLAGVATAIVLLLAAVLLLPEPSGVGEATPSPPASAAPSPTPVATTPGPSASAAASIGSASFRVGRPAPALELRPLGGQISLASLAGQLATPPVAPPTRSRGRQPRRCRATGPG